MKASNYKFEDTKESVKSYGAYEFNKSSKSYKFEKGGGGGYAFTREVSGSLAPKQTRKIGESLKK